MPGFEEMLAQQAAQTAGNTANTALGIVAGRVMEKHNDKRQLAQQAKLQALQIQGQQQMSDYNLQNQLKMWNETNYEAQLKHMQEAGLNPGLMYGMGGGGGATANVAPGNVSGGDAPKGGGESIAMAGMGMQLGLMQAQQKVLETQADKNQAEATKIRGVDTQETEARIDTLLQGVDNARQQYEITRLEITLKNIENYEKQASQKDRLGYIQYQTEIAAQQLKSATAGAQIDQATIQKKIEIIRQTAIGAALRNELTQAQTDKTRSDIAVNQQQINMWVQTNMREWDKMTQENKKIAIQKLMTDFNTDPVNRFNDNISHFIDNLFYLTK